MSAGKLQLEVIRRQASKRYLATLEAGMESSIYLDSVDIKTTAGLNLILDFGLNCAGLCFQLTQLFQMVLFPNFLPPVKNIPVQATSPTISFWRASLPVR